MDTTELCDRTFYDEHLYHKETTLRWLVFLALRDATAEHLVEENIDMFDFPFGRYKAQSKNRMEDKNTIYQINQIGLFSKKSNFTFWGGCFFVPKLGSSSIFV